MSCRTAISSTFGSMFEPTPLKKTTEKEENQTFSLFSVVALNFSIFIQPKLLFVGTSIDKARLISFPQAGF